jgi:hypothetical protein
MTLYTPYLYSKNIDGWLSYRFSLIGIAIAILFNFISGASYRIGSSLLFISFVPILQVLVNWPHFIVSYKILYKDYADWGKHSAAMLFVPGILTFALSAIVVSVWMDSVHIASNIFYILWMFAAFYLAWHYAGQTWGIMSVAMMRQDMRISSGEKKLLKLTLKGPLLWHVIWGLYQINELSNFSIFKNSLLMGIADAICFSSFIVGLVVFLSRYLKGEIIDERLIGGWLLLYVWYFAIWIDPIFSVLVQLSHALQYFLFSSKLHAGKNLKPNKNISNQQDGIFYVIGIFIVYMAIGWFIFEAPAYFLAVGSNWLIFFSALAAAINIHHYFTDGAIWKLKDPQVRLKLFGRA